MNIVPLEQLTRESFAALMKTSFRVWLTGGNFIELELAEIAPPRMAPAGGAGELRYESFALTFRGPAEPFLPQQTYWFETATRGRFELFIVPLSRDRGGAQYQATFNRLVKSS